MKILKSQLLVTIIVFPPFIVYCHIIQSLQSTRGKKKIKRKRNKYEVIYLMPPWSRSTSKGCHLPS